MLRVRNGEQLERQLMTSDGQEARLLFNRPGTVFTYSGGFVVGTTASGVFEVVTSGETNMSMFITNARIKMVRSGVPSGYSAMRVHYFNEAPSGISDGTAFVVSSSDASKYKGYSDLLNTVDLGQVIVSQATLLNKQMLLRSPSVWIALTPSSAFAAASGTGYQVELDYFVV